MLLRDPVHGLVTFEREEEALVVRLFDTPEVQRLRRIRQLGLTSLAFPGAEHTRFAHAVGAAHVMKLLVARLRDIHEELPFWQRLTSDRARDALVAAFLHDLGHGPLSHLFEDAMEFSGSFLGSLSERDPATGSAGSASSNGRARIPSHEDWTEQILLNPATGVHQVLVENDPDMPRRVAALVRGEHALPYLARAVAGTFDVDRCDYLLRDAHATGVRYGEYDLPWLLSTLRFGEVSDDRAPGLAIDGTKGLSAIESFIMARLFMFQQVYFHKSTRAAEWVVRMILNRSLMLLRDGANLPATPAALRAIAVGETPSLESYLELDDQSLLETMNGWRESRDPILANLCERLRARRLFKTLELFGESAAPNNRAETLERLRAIALEEGFDPDFYCGLDVAEDTPYSRDTSLTVVYPNGRQRRPEEVSFLLDRLQNETLSRVRLIFAPELQERVRAAF